MSTHETLLPAGWKPPIGYANGIAAQGRLVFIAGQVGWDDQQRFQSEELAPQFRQALQNILEVLKQAKGRHDHIVRLTWYVLDKQEYLGALQEVGAAYRELMGRHFPVMAVVQVSGLVEDEARLEIEATAVIPEDRP